MRIGVLGLQGGVSEHVAMMKRVAGEKNVVVVRKAREIKDLDALIIPGGESTTIGKLMLKYGIDKAIKRRKELAIYGTCAGLILLSKKLQKNEQFTLGLMDIKAERNAFGRQRESFEVDLDIPALGKKPFRAVFIRAPKITDCGKGVEILAEFKGGVVLARQGNKLVSAFHPELTGDARMHKYFLTMIR